MLSPSLPKITDLAIPGASLRPADLAAPRKTAKHEGFYGHFPDRNGLLTEMLDCWERMSTEEVRERVEREGGAVGAKLRKAGALTFSSKLLPVDLAVRDWSRRDPAVAERVRRVDNRRMEYLRQLFRAFSSDEDDVEARCILAFSLLIGSHFMAADHGGRSRAEVLEQAVRLLEGSRAGSTVGEA